MMIRSNNKKISLPVFIAVSMMFLCGLLQDEIILGLEFILTLLFVRKIRININFLLVLSFVGLFSVGMIFWGTNNPTMMLKQFIGIVITSVFFYTIVDQKNVTDVFVLGKKWSLFMSIIAIIQQGIVLVHFTDIFLFRIILYRSNISLHPFQSYSLYIEPSLFALILSPAAFASLYRLFGKSKVLIANSIKESEAVIILIAMLFTISSTGYVGLFFGMLLILFEYRADSIKRIAYTIGGVMGFIALYVFLNPVRVRVDAMLDSLLHLNRYNKIEMSTLTLTTNFGVALKSIKDTVGLGGGIGSHGNSYYKYISDLSHTLSLNAQDGNSMFIRLLSEVGIVGVAVILFLIIRIYLKIPNNSKEKILCMCCLVYFFMTLLRFGHYFGNGLWLVVIAYYMLYKSVKESVVFNIMEMDSSGD